MRSKWVVLSGLVWMMALWAGLHASAQQCSSGQGCASNGVGLDHFGTTVLANCDAYSTCVTRDCTDHFTYTDGHGVTRCAQCFSDSDFSIPISPQSSLACLSFIWD